MADRKAEELRRDGGRGSTVAPDARCHMNSANTLDFTWFPNLERRAAAHPIGKETRRRALCQTGTSYGPDAANLLFQIVDQRYLKRRPMVFTSNKEPEEWGAVLHDPDLADAIIDRVLEHGEVLRLQGKSFRNPDRS